jgi:hypothetical protein
LIAPIAHSGDGQDGVECAADRAGHVFGTDDGPVEPTQPRNFAFEVLRASCRLWNVMMSDSRS